MTTAKLRNLLRCPAAPAKDNGRLQRAARRALLVGSGFTTTAEAARWGYARRPRLGSHHWRAMRRALSSVAVKWPSLDVGSSVALETAGSELLMKLINRDNCCAI